MNRLFVALDLPEDITRALTTFKASLHDVRWYWPEQMHLTLKFIGNVDDLQMERIQEELAEIRAGFFSLEFDRLGYFPPDRHPKVLWAGVKKSEPLIYLQGLVENAARHAGVETDDRPYVPHITIGKCQGIQKHEVEEFVENHGELDLEPLHVEEFVLYSSKLTPRGAVHHALESYPLVKA